MLITIARCICVAIRWWATLESLSLRPPYRPEAFTHDVKPYHFSKLQKHQDEFVQIMNLSRRSVPQAPASTHKNLATLHSQLFCAERHRWFLCRTRLQRDSAERTCQVHEAQYSGDLPNCYGRTSGLQLRAAQKRMFIPSILGKDGEVPETPFLEFHFRGKVKYLPVCDSTQHDELVATVAVCTALAKRSGK